MSKSSKGFALTILVLSLVFATFAGAQTSQASALLTPAQTLAAALDALSQSDTATFNRYIQQSADPQSKPVKSVLFDSSLDAVGKDFTDAVMAGFTYEITDESIQGDTAVVTVTATNNDLSNVLMYMILESIADSDETHDTHLNLMLSRAVEKGAQRTSEITFTLHQENDTWTVIIDGAAMDAICGNLFTGTPAAA